MKKLFLFPVFMCILVACSPNEDRIDVKPDTTVKSVDDVEVQDGVLKFESRDHLKNVISELTSRQDMINWYSGGDFKSLLQRQESISEEMRDHVANTGEFGDLQEVLFFREENQELILEKIVEDARLAAVLNSKGFVIVADTIYHIGKDAITSASFSGNSHVFKKFTEEPNLSSWSSTPFIREYSSAINKNAKISDLQIEYHPSGMVRRRFMLEFIHNNIGIYQSLLVKIRHQKKNWIGWSGANANYISFDAYGDYWVNFPSDRRHFSTSKSANNVEELSHFIREEYGISLGWLSPRIGYAPHLEGAPGYNFYGLYF